MIGPQRYDYFVHQNTLQLFGIEQVVSVGFFCEKMTDFV